MTHETQMLLGLFLGIAIMIILVMKTKIHTFIALLLAALIAGLIGGMAPGDVVDAIQVGFGNTLQSTGIIIGLGVMKGGILEKREPLNGWPTRLSKPSEKAKRSGPWE